MKTTLYLVSILAILVVMGGLSGVFPLQNIGIDTPKQNSQVGAAVMSTVVTRPPIIVFTIQRMGSWFQTTYGSGTYNVRWSSNLPVSNHVDVLLVNLTTGRSYFLGKNILNTGFIQNISASRFPVGQYRIAIKDVTTNDVSYSNIFAIASARTPGSR